MVLNSSTPFDQAMSSIAQPQTIASGGLLRPAVAKPDSAMPKVYEPSKKAEPAKAEQKAQEDLDAERLRQRIMMKQAALASLGLDWEPDEADIIREREHLPDDGNLIKLPEMDLSPRDYRQAAQEEKFAPGFDSFEDPDAIGELTEEEAELLRQHRATKTASGYVGGVGPMAAAGKAGEAALIPEETMDNKAKQSEAALI